MQCGPEYLSRYKDSLRAGRSVDRIQVRARLPAPVHTGPKVHPASYTMGIGYFPGLKRRGHGVDHPNASSTDVKERVKPHISPSKLASALLG